MTNFLTKMGTGSIAFAIGPSLIDSGQHAIADTMNRAGQALENPDNYVKGLIVTGVFQLLFKAFDVWRERRKEKKAAKEAAEKQK